MASSPKDSRKVVVNFGPGPNASRSVQGSLIYDVQISSNPAVPGVDDRIAIIVPLDSRISPNIPLNSRT